MKRILPVLLTGMIGASAVAQVDSNTQDMLIDKLTRVYLSLPAADASRGSIVLRLADLHAERARQATLKELNSGCTVCEAGKEDRKKAIRYYEENLAKLPLESQGKVLIQLGHLYEMLNDEGKAVATYQKVIAGGFASTTISEAQLSLGEMYFKKAQFDKALTHYKEVLKLGGSKGLAAYRTAWSEFNLGRTDEATQVLVMMLKNPEFLNRTASTQTVSVDKQFQEEVSRDLATFMAKSDKQRQVSLLYSLSPETTALDNVFYLASELERLGQAQASLDSWKFLLEKENRPTKKIAVHLHLAQNSLETKNMSQAAADFDTASALWQSANCSQDSQCAELKTLMRKFVTDFHKAEKKAPSEALYASYLKYLEIFPQDTDMKLWSGEVAKELKKYKESFAAFTAASDTALNERLASQDAKVKTEKAQFAENALLAAIESAELSQDAGLQTLAADNYLTKSVEKKKAFEVQYQKAHMLYEKNNYQAASVELKQLALNTTGSLDVRKKAADLALDSLALLKDDKNIEAWSAEFAAALPQASTEFAALSRKSVLKQSAENQDVNAAWAALTRYSLNGATAEEKASYYKNKLILAEKRQDFREARMATEEMLRLPNLTAQDREFALSRKAYLAELTLDFGSALTALTDLKSSEDKTLLKLGMYASLAQKDPKPFYRQYLTKDNKTDEAVIVAAMLVRESTDSLQELNKNKAVLSKNPELLAELYLEIYGKTKKSDILKTVAADAKLANTVSGKVLTRSEMLAEYVQIKNKISSAKIDSANQKKLTASLKARAALIESVEKMASKAIAKADWSAQLLSLDLLAKESRRFYEELLSLPVPQGLSAEDEQTYLSLLSQQAAPHKQRADDVDQKVNEFWAQADAINKLKDSYEKTNKELQSYAVEEVSLLKERAPENIKSQMQAWVLPQNLVAGLSVAEVEKAREAVREKPMDKARVQSLLEVEKRMGHQQMVQYLESRILSMGESNKGAN